MTGEIFGMGSPFDFLDIASSYSFVFFNLFSAPCIATIATMKKELGNNKEVLIAIIYLIMIAWILSSEMFYVLKTFNI